MNSRKIFLCFIIFLFLLLSEEILAERLVVYFYTPTCGSCIQSKRILETLKMEYTDLSVMEINITDDGGMVFLENYNEKYNVEGEKRGLVPSIFYGEQALVGLSEIEANLEGLLKIPQKTLRPEEHKIGNSVEKIISRFKTFNAGTILIAGLIDGINPCAFSTLIFFISFLVVTGQRGRKILYVGISFTSGIFLSYLLMGWGLFKVLGMFQSLTDLARWIYPITALIVTGLAIVSFMDYYKVHRKRSSQMFLTLPKRIIKIMQQIVRN